MKSSFGCEKRLHHSGHTSWYFQDDDLSATKIKNDDIQYPCRLEHSPEKGIGVFYRGSETLGSGSRVVTESSMICLPTGKHRARVCMTCLKFGHKKVKVSEDCPHLFFCSHDCLHEMDDLTTFCGPIITQVSLFW